MIKSNHMGYKLTLPKDPRLESQKLDDCCRLRLVDVKLVRLVSLDPI